MNGNRLITENQLDEWVRANAGAAQGVIVELIVRLIAASCPQPNDKRFPLPDSIGQPGPDGFLDVAIGSTFVPEGKSYWEIGTGLKPSAKATKDYNGLVKSVATDIRAGSSFVFVTPLSGRRGWNATAQNKWLAKRQQRQEWHNVVVIDGTRLVHWLEQWPAVQSWLANAIGQPAHDMQTPEQCWGELCTIGAPPPLTPAVFLVNREAACAKLQEVFTDNAVQLKIDTRFPDQVPAFVCAYVAAMPGGLRTEVVGRCLVISSPEAWNARCSLRDRHILIAAFALDENEGA